MTVLLFKFSFFFLFFLSFFFLLLLFNHCHFISHLFIYIFICLFTLVGLFLSFFLSQLIYFKISNYSFHCPTYIFPFINLSFFSFYSFFSCLTRHYFFFLFFLFYLLNSFTVFSSEYLKKIQMKVTHSSLIILSHMKWYSATSIIQSRFLFKRNLMSEHKNWFQAKWLPISTEYRTINKMSAIFYISHLTSFFSIQ